MRAIYLAFSIVAVGIPVFAGPPPAPGPNAITVEAAPDPVAIAAAERFLAAMDFERMMLRTTDAMIAQMGPSLKKSIEAETGETMDDELIVRLTSVQAKFLRTHIVDDPKVRRAIGILYARHFTAAELDRLAILYRDPVMRKWTEMAPEMMGDWMPLIFDMMNAHGNDLKAELKQTAEDYFAEKNREEGGAT